MENTKIQVDDLKKFVKTILTRADIPNEETEYITDALIDADMAGSHSHGVIQIPDYLQKLRAGRIKKQTSIQIVRETLGTALLSAENGWGQIASYKAMQMAVEKAKVVGTGFIGITCSNSFSDAGYFSNIATRFNCIGVAMTNNPLSVTTMERGKNTVRRLNSTAVSVPTRGGPITFDATKKNEAWTLLWDEQDGRKHSPRPFVAPMNSDLVMMIEIMSGVLTGSSFGMDTSRSGDDSTPQNAGHFLGAINVEAFMDPELFLDRIEEYCCQIRNGSSGPGFKKASVPGDWNNKIRIRSLTEGVSLPLKILKKLTECSLFYQVEPPHWTQEK